MKKSENLMIIIIVGEIASHEKSDLTYPIQYRLSVNLLGCYKNCYTGKYLYENLSL